MLGGDGHHNQLGGNYDDFEMTDFQLKGNRLLHLRTNGILEIKMNGLGDIW